MAHVKGRRYILYIGVCFDHSIFIEQLETGLQIPGTTELTDVATYHTKFSACIIGQDATLAFGKFGSNVSRKLVVKLCRRQVLQVDIINREVWTPAIFAIIEPFYSGFQFEPAFFESDESCQTKLNPVLETFTQGKSDRIFQIP